MQGVRVEVWPTSAGALHLPLLHGIARAERVAAVLRHCPPGAAVVVEAADLRDALLASGAHQVRHLHTMRHDLRPPASRPAVPGLTLRGWETADPERLAPALVGAYGADHPDTRDPDLAAAAALRDTADDPDNPLLPATRVAVLDGSPVGAALVVRSEHFSRWSGPWLMNVFRAPIVGAAGAGPAMICWVLEALRHAGEQDLGLAVTSTNPARRTYEQLGFTYDLEAWVLVLPGG